MRYIIFTRVSTNMQTVENQMKECIEYADAKKVLGDEVIQFEEPETSSRIPMDKREKLQSMLNFVRSGDTIIVYKLDRLARDGEELVYIYRSKFIKRGVKVVSLYEPHIDNANIHIYAFLAETERNNIRTRTISGFKRKQAKMEKVGGTLFGYKTDENELQLHHKQARSYGKPYKLVPEETEQKALEMMVGLYKDGLSYQEIADQIEEAGYRNRVGNPIQKMTIYRILLRLEKQNPALFESAYC